ncbi:MAG TPA: radical SAM protein, partial [Syntrophorhabdaceae bacterium]|nr:radical SAM protein [Syntrophorhabdaceae bacterium]
MPRFREKAGDVGLKGLIELSFSDWEGRMSSVLFTGGCNFRCPYCHNRDLALGGAGIDDMPYDLVKERLDAQKLWVDSVVITGGEPTLHRGMTAVMADLKSSGY